MRHLQKQTWLQRFQDALVEFIGALMPSGIKEWVMLLLICILLMVAVAQSDSINKLYGYVLAMMENALK